jgi:hypothetical protein
MHARQRFLNALRGDRVDRAPLLLKGFHYASPDDVEDPGKREIVERVAGQLHLFTGSPYVVSRYPVTSHRRMYPRCRPTSPPEA